MTGSTVEVQFTLSDFVKDIQSELNDKYTTFTKLTEVVNEKTNGGVEIMENTDFTQTLLSQFEDISAQVRQHETYTDRWGYECARYYAVDVQENEVIVVDAKNNYNYFGLSFTMNGDKAEIDFESGKKVIKHLEQMPPVTPQPKTGHWIDKDVRGSIEPYCSVCGDSVDTIYHYNYCPNCGTKMIKLQESEDKDADSN